MIDAERKRIDALLSEISDRAATDAVQELESLLLDRPDLQAYYCQAITMLALLDLEFLQSEEQSRHVGRLGALVTAKSTPQEGATPVRRGTSQSSVSRHSSRWARRSGVVLAIAGAAAIALTAWLNEPGGENLAQGTPGRLWSSGPSDAKPTRELVVDDSNSLRLLGRLTRHPLVSNVTLPGMIGDDPTARIRLCSGTAWIDRISTNRERGYLLALPRGCLMEVDIDAEATGENSLAVAEIGPAGRVTGETLLFGNSYGTGDRSGKLKAGHIGSFSKFNHSEETAYYLLTGSYLLEGEDGEDVWRQSDYKIQLDAEDLLVIGWDDSGYYGSVKNPDSRTPDRDFNDMHAVFRFSFPEKGAGQMERLSRYLPLPTSDEIKADVATGDGYALDVKPGEEVAISVGCYASRQNAFRVIDLETNRVIWKRDGVPAEIGKTQPTDLGVYLIRNHGQTVRQYEIQGLYKHPEDALDAPWRVSPHQVVDDGSGGTIVGFEDCLEQRGNIDWKDLRVYLRGYSRQLSDCFSPSGKL